MVGRCVQCLFLPLQVLVQVLRVVWTVLMDIGMEFQFVEGIMNSNRIVSDTAH